MLDPAPRVCCECGTPVPPKAPRKSVSTGKHRWAPKNRPVRCAECRMVPKTCEVCTEPYLAPVFRTATTCSASCGSVLAMRTRKERGDFAYAPKRRKTREVKTVVPTPKRVRTPVVEWRGSAIDKIRQIRGDAW